MPTLDQIADRIDGHVTKYMGILQIAGKPPLIKLRSNLGSKWLGRSTWSTKQPDTTLLELQTSILGDDRTLERVIAHEMIHHRDALALTQNDIALVRIGIKPAAHGASFREGAAIINAIMGPEFVTAVSDQEYKHTASTKKFVMLISPLPNGKLGWAWATRIGPKAQSRVDKEIADGARLVHTSDDRWTRGAKIERYGGYSLPRNDQEAALLKELYESA